MDESNNMDDLAILVAEDMVSLQSLIPHIFNSLPPIWYCYNDDYIHPHPPSSSFQPLASSHNSALNRHFFDF